MQVLVLLLFMMSIVLFMMSIVLFMMSIVLFMMSIAVLAAYHFNTALNHSKNTWQDFAIT